MEELYVLIILLLFFMHLILTTGWSVNEKMNERFLILIFFLFCTQETDRNFRLK
jgi:hypothetical protein